jgi:hypothetical protein
MFAVAAQGRWVMKAICEAVGRRARTFSVVQRWPQGRTPTNDGQLPIELREHVGEMPQPWLPACVRIGQSH